MPPYSALLGTAQAVITNYCPALTCPEIDKDASQSLSTFFYPKNLRFRIAE
jgi:hypothetical protein